MRAAEFAPHAPLIWRSSKFIKQLPVTAFLPLLRAAVVANPDRADLKLQLVRTLFHADQPAEVVDLLKSTAVDSDTEPELLYYLGRSALAIQDNQLALDALQMAAGRGFGRALGYLAEALYYFGHNDEALDAGLRGVEVAPSDFKAFGIVARLLLDRGAVERLWSLCAHVRKHGAWGTYIPSAMALAAVTPEQEREVANLIDPTRWFCAQELPDADGFNDRIASELLNHKSLATLPSTKSTVGSGYRIGQLDLIAGPATQVLIDRIRDAVEAYVAERQGYADHPMIANRPPSVVLNSWALVVHDDGHEEWHIHPDGWISGVYYVCVPDLKSSPHGHAGAIEFGFNPFGWKEVKPLKHRWHIKPKTGLLLLFPSYYPHQTWPTGVGDPRICVAFDILPAAT